MKEKSFIGFAGLYPPRSLVNAQLSNISLFPQFLLNIGPIAYILFQT